MNFIGSKVGFIPHSLEDILSLTHRLDSATSKQSFLSPYTSPCYLHPHKSRIERGESLLHNSELPSKAVNSVTYFDTDLF
ncbi:unnamed protein product [Hymenolepis diminuta]|uniref:Uncharacterized protein n=1 Tax=Hymenolepis diminuta TaxID=6216 RepID=A0A564YLQ9_HYMDI|nr:unnamed protein product [Hymenolepis diminuta]